MTADGDFNPELHLYMVEARAELALEEASFEVRWHEVVRDELVACTLGARRRPELRTDAVGRIMSAFHQMGRIMRAFGEVAR